MSQYDEEPGYSSYELNETVNLEPPGAGLPNFERAFLNMGLRFFSFVKSGENALKLFKSETLELRRLANHEEGLAAEQVVIPRMMGIEDSSRNWSVLMVIQHLRQTNSEMLTCIKALRSGQTPRGKIDIADYKPDPDIGFGVIESYRDESIAYEVEIEGLLEQHGSLKSSQKFQHPWFGPMNAHQWHCLCALHQRIHRKQAQKIYAVLGIA